jgi:hypothetical protein
MLEILHNIFIGFAFSFLIFVIVLGITSVYIFFKDYIEVIVPGLLFILFCYFLGNLINGVFKL